MIRRRSLLTAPLLGSPLLAALPASAQQPWPTRPLRFVVPFAAGAGILDIMARLLAQHLTEQLGQQVVVDNKPGAGGNVGAEIVAKATPDGYTLLIANQAMLVSPFLYAHMGYDPLKDLLPITMINSAPLMLVVHPGLPVQSFKELLAYSKANPGKLNYGSGGVGSTPFLAVESLKAATGLDATHVPYKGGAPALADLVAGQLAFMIENVPGTLPLVKDGKLRALAITSSKRSPLVPDLPTLQEAGVPGYEMIGWNGLFVPTNTPVDIATRLHDTAAKILRSPDVAQQFAKLGADPVGDAQATFASFTRAETDRWGKIIREKGIKPE